MEFKKKAFLPIVFMAIFQYLPVFADKHEPLLIGGSAEAIFDTSITDTEIMMSLFFSQSLKDTGESFKIKVYDNDQKLQEAIETKQVTAFFADAVQFTEWEQQFKPQANYMVVIGNSQKPVYKLIVNADDEISSVDQLRGKTIVIPFGHAVGKMFLDVELLKRELPVSTSFFKSIKNTHQSNSAIIDLYFKKIQAAVVTDFSLENAYELNPQLKNKIKVLESSQPLAHMVFSFTWNFPEELLTSMEPYIMNLQNMPRVRKILERFQFQGLMKMEKDTLNGVKGLIKQYKLLKK